MSTQQDSITRQLLFLDGTPHKIAHHALLKSLTQVASRATAEIRRFIQTVLTSIQFKEHIDVVKDIASPISILTSARIMGMPTDNYDKLMQLEQWSNAFGDYTSGYLRVNMEDIRQLEEYFRQLIEFKRDHPANDLLSIFIKDKSIFPSEADLLSNCMMIFSAGHTTTKKLLGNGIPLLLPGWQQLRKEFLDDSRRLPWLLCEELLRIVTPTRYLIRHASETFTFPSLISGDHLIRQGQKMLLFLDAGNRDPAIFPSPHQLDFHRQQNRHLAFGYGSHQCPGASLARSQIQMVLEELLSHADLSAYPHATPIWNRNPNLGGFDAYPIQCFFH